jgi:hypothetical protein
MPAALSLNRGLRMEKVRSLAMPLACGSARARQRLTHRLPIQTVRNPAPSGLF